MELVLFRTYHDNGTNGELYANRSLQCYTIELPWKDNLPGVSCIPEGRYGLKKRYSPRFKHHLILQNVPGRSLVLVHPANDALAELRGCIAPVSYLSAPGKGNESKKAFEKLLKPVSEALEKEPVFLTIKSKEDDFTTKGKGPNA
jgi:hypothetical protein